MKPSRALGVMGGDRLADLLGDPLEAFGGVAVSPAGANSERPEADELGEVGDRLELTAAPRAQISRRRRIEWGDVAPDARATVRAL
ncbi:MAG TPA: hypothetical protein VFZ00_32045 [Solirubrobacter sp.]|nr:hypothetical protein [Solirubrobacter sp.]